MDQQVVINSLKEGAEKDPITNAVLQTFAARKRARQNITVTALEQTMKKHGFSHKKEEYAKTLRFLSSIGLGHIELDSKGRVKALKGVRMTLRSIGAVALGKQASLTEKQRERTQFSELKEKKAVAKTKLMEVATPVVPRQTPPVKVSVMISGQPLSFDVPKGFNELEIAKLIVVLRDRLAL